MKNLNRISMKLILKKCGLFIIINQQFFHNIFYLLILNSHSLSQRMHGINLEELVINKLFLHFLFIFKSTFILLLNSNNLLSLLSYCSSLIRLSSLIKLNTLSAFIIYLNSQFLFQKYYLIEKILIFKNISLS
jgi:hypothetical protein